MAQGIDVSTIAYFLVPSDWKSMGPDGFIYTVDLPPFYY